jgi:hypothetical protein
MYRLRLRRLLDRLHVDLHRPIRPCPTHRRHRRLLLRLRCFRATRHRHRRRLLRPRQRKMRWARKYVPP